MKITIVFKNGYQLNVTCEEFAINTQLGIPYSYSAKGVKDNKPLFIKLDDVLCVYREMEGESE